MESVIESEVRLSIPARLTIGVFVPVSALILYGWLLFGAASAKGSATAINALYVAISGITRIPALAVINCWVLFVPCRRKSPLFVAGLILPFFVAILAYLAIFGSFRESQFAMRFFKWHAMP